MSLKDKGNRTLAVKSGLPFEPVIEPLLNYKCVEDADTVNTASSSLDFSEDGLIYVKYDYNNNKFLFYILSSPFEPSTQTSVTEYTPSSISGNTLNNYLGFNISLSSDGTKFLYIQGENNGYYYIVTLTMSTAGRADTATRTYRRMVGSNNRGFIISQDATVIVYLDYNSSWRKMTTTTPYDFSSTTDIAFTWDLGNTTYPSKEGKSYFNATGTKLIVENYSYLLSTPYDLTTTSPIIGNNMYSTYRSESFSYSKISAKGSRFIIPQEYNLFVCIYETKDGSDIVDKIFDFSNYPSFVETPNIQLLRKAVKSKGVSAIDIDRQRLFIASQTSSYTYVCVNDIDISSGFENANYISEFSKEQYYGVCSMQYRDNIKQIFINIYNGSTNYTADYLIIDASNFPINNNSPYNRGNADTTSASVFRFIDNDTKILCTDNSMRYLFVFSSDGYYGYATKLSQIWLSNLLPYTSTAQVNDAYFIDSKTIIIGTQYSAGYFKFKLTNDWDLSSIDPRSGEYYLYNIYALVGFNANPAYSDYVIYQSFIGRDGHIYCVNCVDNSNSNYDVITILKH